MSRRRDSNHPSTNQVLRIAMLPRVQSSYGAYHVNAVCALSFWLFFTETVHWAFLLSYARRCCCMWCCCVR